MAQELEAGAMDSVPAVPARMAVLFVGSTIGFVLLLMGLILIGLVETPG